MPLRRRELLLLQESITSLEAIAFSSEPLDPRKLGRLFSDLRSFTDRCIGWRKPAQSPDRDFGGCSAGPLF